MLRSIIVAALATVFSTVGATAANLDLEDLTVGTQYNVGDTFTTGGVLVTAEDFTFAGGVTFNLGFAEVQDNIASLSGGTDNELEVNNILLDFAIAPTTSLSLNFGEFGGNLNLRINGAFANFENFSSLNGASLGGVGIAVTNGFGDDRGVLSLSGSITDFAIGGQELWIDNIETAPAVPLPANVLLLGGGLAALLRLRRKSLA